MWRSTPNVPSTTPVGFCIDSSTGPCSMCSSRYAPASMVFNSRCASSIRSSATPFSASASTSRVPCRSVSSRTLSIFRLPAAAADPSRLRPNRAPSSSAQSTSFSVTGGVVPAYMRSASSPAMTPREPSSHPPFGTESRWLPTMTVFAEAPGSVTQLLPAESVPTCSPSSAILPLNHSRASRHTGPQARRCAPSGVEVRAASSRRSAITRCAFIGQLLDAAQAPSELDRSAARPRGRALPGGRWQA